MPISKQAVRILSQRQREFLLLHIDGPAQVTISAHTTRSALVAKKLLRHDRPIHPRQTFLTPDGRFAIAVILADAADVLVAAGVLDAELSANLATKIAARNGAQRLFDGSSAPEQILPTMPL